jgi:hypothetical protein
METFLNMDCVRFFLWFQLPPTWRVVVVGDIFVCVCALSYHAVLTFNFLNKVFFFLIER